MLIGDIGILIASLTRRNTRVYGENHMAVKSANLANITISGGFQDGFEMNEETYLKMVTESFERRLVIHKRKSHDYANQEEMLGNFKRVAQIFKALKPDVSTPAGVAVVYIVLKIDRFCNLAFSGKVPRNESLQDTMDDLKNYCDLLEGCWIDERKP